MFRQQLKRNGLDNEWFKEYAKKKFEEHKNSDSIQYKFSMDNEAITVMSKESKKFTSTLYELIN